MRDLIDALIREALAPYIDRIAELETEIDDLHRRARNQGRRGVVVAVDHGSGRCKVKHGGNTTPWIRWACRAAGEVREWRPPSVGEGCELINHGGGDDGAQAIAVPGIPTSVYPPAGSSATLHRLTYKDGATEDYDFASHAYAWTNGQTTIKHDRNGIELMHGSNGIRIDASGVHNLGAGVDHDGTDIGKTHKHGGIIAGNSKTDVPS
ncbi:phage baseplate assembly protein V [Parasedimentitalea maritima]|uniref:Phage baseplate assembly protein V n=1 Tax=Parasedimentitalea maritima TaxID=2578117 RepID=A0A6A4R6B7_9RHOB|nr:phage baseplate assembly protein V [Zongyanglinia marina]KAE9624489.1 phage baseplate assembly protein V [Zongyanglinia marina]